MRVLTPARKERGGRCSHTPLRAEKGWSLARIPLTARNDGAPIGGSFISGMATSHTLYAA
jgi:hypothetical protein